MLLSGGQLTGDGLKDCFKGMVSDCWIKSLTKCS